MDALWSQLLQSLGLSAMVVAGVAWLARAVVVESLSREAFRLQEQLRRDTAAALEDIRQRGAMELERFRHALDLQLAEHGVRFGKLHERRFEFITALYAAIEAPLRAAVRIQRIRIRSAYIDQSESDNEEDAIEAVGKLEDLVEAARKALADARLYLPEDLDDRISALLETVQRPLTSASIKVLTRRTQLSRKAHGLPSDDERLDLQGIYDDFARMPKNEMTALKELARECRTLLGVFPPEQPSPQDTV